MTTTSTSQAADNEASAIRSASARWLAAVDVRNLAAIAAMYADDGVFLVPSVPFARGHEQVTAKWARLLSAPNLSLVSRPVSIDVAQLADLAYEISTYQLGLDGAAGRIEDDGK